MAFVLKSKYKDLTGTILMPVENAMFSRGKAVSISVEDFKKNISQYVKQYPQLGRYVEETKKQDK